MIKHTEVMKQALEALKSCDAAHITDGGRQWYDEKLVDKAVEAIEKALASEAKEQPAPATELREQEPVAWMHPDGRVWTFGRGLDKSTFTIPLYTSPQAQRKPLTDEEIERCMKQAYATVQGRNLELAFARAIEAAHNIKE